MNVKLKSCFFLNHTNSLSPHRNGMAYGHHVDPHARIESEHLCNSRNFICRKADSHRKQSVLSVGQQPDVQNCRLQKSRQTSRYNLFTPAVKFIGVPPRNPEHIQTSDRYLTQQDSAPFNVRKHNFYGTVAE